MAQITITTTAAQDAAVKRATEAYNTSSPPPAESLTPLQFAQQLLQGALNALVARYSTEDTQTKAQLYQKASAADKTTIDSILAKYA